MTAAYYNEIDPKAAAWLLELIRAGLIADGDVDERSISDVSASDVRGYTQCHFFAGIGGWSYALRLAGWPDDRPVWTGSCPCQPFSSAGKQRGTADERHLWPQFARLIGECKPATVFGEQVASKLGRTWLSGVLADLEGMGYAAAGADLCAAGVGAPHIRQRLYWMGHAENPIRWADERSTLRSAGASDGRSGLVYTSEQGSQGHGGFGEHDAPATHSGHAAAAGGQWRDAIWITGRDGKTRPIGPGITPLAHGIPARVVRLRGYGNAIVPQVAAEFVRAFEEARVSQQ